jgi:protein-S-isoprenylcysteine O-methyltransferase Ste14
VNGNFVQRGGLWVLGQSALLLAVLAGGVLCRGGWQSAPVTSCGAVLLVAGAVVGLAGAAALRGHLTPFPKPASKARLVQSGVYSLMRHPLYTAVFLGAVGWGLVWRSWPALVAGLALGPFFDAKARREERWLRQHFPGYALYEQRVRRFIPGIY